MAAEERTSARQPPDVDPETWLREHGDVLFSYALVRVRDRHHAEDLVQETLLGAMQSHHRFEGRSSVRTWLVSILRNKLVDRRRTMRRSTGGQAERVGADVVLSEEALERFVESQFDRTGKWCVRPGAWGRPSADPSSASELDELRRILEECLDKLPPRGAEAIELLERQGMSLVRISTILGITKTNAGVLLHRARLATRHCLERNGYTDRTQ